MILDSLKNIDYYTQLGSRFQTGFLYLQDTIFNELSDGRHEIEGQDLFVLVNSYETEDGWASKFEAHRRYIDIHLILEGEELIYWSHTHKLNPIGKYQVEKDLLLFQNPVDSEERSSALYLVKGFFALFFPWDAHKPNCSIQGPRKVRKAVIKLRL